MIDSLQMKYFIAVAEEKSFSAAAKRLFVSQQTLSAHIALIEKEMGITYRAIDDWILHGKGTEHDLEVMRRFHDKSEHKRRPIPVYRGG